MTEESVEAGAPTGEDCDWAVFRGDPAMTGVAGVALGLPLELAWTFRSSREPGGSGGCKATAIVNRGRVYVGDDTGVFRCLGLEDGVELWSFRTNGAIEGAGCFTSGGLVVFGSGDGFIHALDRDTGEQRWRFVAGGEVPGSMNLWCPDEGGEGLVVFGSYDNFCYAVSAATGEKCWEFETESYINGAVAIADDQIMFGGCDGFVYRLAAATGELLGRIEVGSYIAGTMAVDAGIAYAGHYGNRVVALELGSGRRLWEYGEREFPFFSSPAVSAGRLVIGGRDKRVHCIDRKTGEGIWERRLGDQVDSSPVVSGEVVFVGCDDGVLYGLSLANGEELWSYELGGAVKGSPAVVGGFLVITTDDSGVHAFRRTGGE